MIAGCSLHFFDTCPAAQRQMSTTISTNGGPSCSNPFQLSCLTTYLLQTGGADFATSFRSDTGIP